MSEPWETEPDSKEWKAHGFHCEIHRHPTAGHLCGYVDVPLGHPCHGVSDRWAARPKLPNFDVHGGITWAEWREPPYINDRWTWGLGDLGLKPHWLGRLRYRLRHLCWLGWCWWLRTFPHRNSPWRIGFDCSHLGDISPRWNALYAPRGIYSFGDGTYRDMAYVTRETEHLAEQLAAIAKAKGGCSMSTTTTQGLLAEQREQATKAVIEAARAVLADLGEIDQNPTQTGLDGYAWAWTLKVKQASLDALRTALARYDALEGQGGAPDAL